LFWAKQQGYQGMQFNFVVSTNTGAIALWKKLGFTTIGTIPRGFRHAQLGYVDVNIMYRQL
jgi:ribosomal protein S18 acetylase RimI-like enzyme